MPETILTVGPGKTYDSASGITDAIAALPSDFAGESDNWRIVITEGYDYTKPSGGNIIDSANTTALKHIIIEAESGSEHLGDFSQGVNCVIDGTASSFFFCSSAYTEFWNLKGTIPVTGNARYNFIYFNNGTTVNTLCQNILFQVLSTDPSVDRASAVVYVTPGATGHVINNLIGWSDPAAGSNRACINIGSSDVQGTINNLVSYDFTRGVAGGGATWEMNNSGAVYSVDGTGSGRFDNCVSFTGSSNYTNSTVAVPGTNALTTTLSLMKFLDLPNKNFLCNRGSILIGSGTDVTSDNPNTIRLIPWTGNHRSPFDYAQVYNTYRNPPEIKNVYGGYASKIMLADPGQSFGAPLYGALEETLIIEYKKDVDYVGEYIEYTNSRKSIYLQESSGSKYMTVSCLYRADDPVGGSPTEDILVDGGIDVILNKVTKELSIDIGGGTFVGTADLTSVEITDWFSFVISIDLTQSTDAERIKVRTFQTTVFHDIALSFTGTAPSGLNTNTTYRIGPCKDVANLCAWHRLLNEGEINSLLYDPYKMYRDNTGREYYLRAGLLSSGGRSSNIYNLNKSPAFIGAGANARVLNG